MNKVGVISEEGPPVPIPNTVVKLFSAENTWRVTAREDKATPTFLFLISLNSSVAEKIVLRTIFMLRYIQATGVACTEKGQSTRLLTQ
jgi:hypothetical protein